MYRAEPPIHEAGTHNLHLPARNQKPTLSQYCVHILTDVYPNIYLILFGFLAKLISDKAIDWGAQPFEGVCGASSNTTKVALNFNEAFQKSLADIVHMTLFIMVYAATLILTLLLSKVLEATLVSLAPFYYFTPLLAKAPNFSVIFGTIELPIFCFVFSWAIVFSLLQGFLISLVLFISWMMLMPCDPYQMPTPHLEPAIPHEPGESGDTSNEQEMEEVMVEGTREVFEMVAQYEGMLEQAH